MTTRSHLITAALTTALLTTPVFVFAGHGQSSTGNTPPAMDRGTPPGLGDLLADIALAELDANETATLLFMREEERLARDVYTQFDTLWQSPPFAGIARSEQKHMDALQLLLDRYTLTDPSDPTVVGVFTNTELQQLYGQLTATGAQSLLDALTVGALIEETDIGDLTAAIAATDNADLQEVYNHLLRGSRNHLRAYVTEIERQGGDAYVAQQLTQDEVDAIVAEPMERGGHGRGDMPPPDAGTNSATGNNTGTTSGNNTGNNTNTGQRGRR